MKHLYTLTTLLLILLPNFGHAQNEATLSQSKVQELAELYNIDEEFVLHFAYEFSLIQEAVDVYFSADDPGIKTMRQHEAEYNGAALNALMALRAGNMLLESSTSNSLDMQAQSIRRQIGQLQDEIYQEFLPTAATESVLWFEAVFGIVCVERIDPVCDSSIDRTEHFAIKLMHAIIDFELRFAAWERNLLRHSKEL